MFGGSISPFLGGALAAGVSAVLALRWSRAPVYLRLNEKIGKLKRDIPAGMSFSVRHAAPEFSDRFAVVREFLPGELLDAMRNEVAELDSERSYVPGHKQGETVAYERLIVRAPKTVSFYHNAAFQSFISNTVGARVLPTPVWDQSSLSILIYRKPGDHIGWHYDHNFYRGRHFTVLLILRNEGAGPGQSSHSTLVINRHGNIRTISTEANTLIVFEGSRVLHMVTPVHDGEIRIALSMTYCTDDRAYWWRGIGRRIKDTAFFGVRALWT